MLSLTLHEHPALSLTRTAGVKPSIRERRPLLQLAIPAPRLPLRHSSARAGVLASIAVHLGAVLLIAIASARPPGAVTAREASNSPSVQRPRLVFLYTPGPSGGGGGGGTRQKTVPARAQAPGRDPVTLRTGPPLGMSSVTPAVEPQEQEVVLDARPLMSGATLMTGLPDAGPSGSASGGPGSGGGVGGGQGTGIGSGFGPGFGPGSGGGYGGGMYMPGNGATAPTLLKQVKPRYTPNALQFKIQGTVVLDVVIDTEGVPTSIRVRRGLDPGLDEEAIAAVREWRFTPGRVGGSPVNTLVRIEIDFHIV